MIDLFYLNASKQFIITCRYYPFTPTGSINDSKILVSLKGTSSGISFRKIHLYEFYFIKYPIKFQIRKISRNQ